MTTLRNYYTFSGTGYPYERAAIEDCARRAREEGITILRMHEARVVAGNGAWEVTFYGEERESVPA